MTYTDATEQEINDVLKNAATAFTLYKKVTPQQKAAFLRSIAEEILAVTEELTGIVMQETNLPQARVTGETGRTVGQCRMFADHLEEGSWVEARIDTAIPDRAPLPKPDIRKMLMPIGPVVIFGASNFPLAFSTAGGDTISALAAGCPVVVKGHPGHPRASHLVASCIQRAAGKTGMPANVFQHVYGTSFTVGQALVLHPLTKAVAFTGSYAGGKALFDLANKRPEPIPVFSEMGSINPVFILPAAMKSRRQKIAEIYASSITQSAGQFCTNPGLLLVEKNTEATEFITALGAAIQNIPPAPMLHAGIAANFEKGRQHALEQKGVTLVAESGIEATGQQGIPSLATVALNDFISNPVLAEEVFGPYSIVVQGENITALEQALDQLPGQLTATIMAEEEDLQQYSELIERIAEKVGRVIINGVPTGVEVCPSMHHGGPFPSTTDSRFTSVGTDAIRRFVRPVCFQGYPQFLLPDALKDHNPLRIWRFVNARWER